MSLWRRLWNRRSASGWSVPLDPSVDAERETRLTFDNVTFFHGGRLVFEGLSLDLVERRIGLIGDNGSGKSTLLRLAKGLLVPQAGRVVVNGLNSLEAFEAVSDEVGFLFQNPDHQLIFPTVGEEVAFGLTEGGLGADEARRQAIELLAVSGCGGWEDRSVHDLSEGQKQLVCILAILAPWPKTLLFDEPFSSLDLPTKYGLSARLDALPQQILMASHDLDLLEGFDRIIWLQRGTVRMDGAPHLLLPVYRAESRRAAAL